MKLTRQSIIFEITARLQRLLVPRLDHRVVYIHIPKYGGVSVSKALKACYASLNLRDDNLYKLDSVACLNAAQSNVGRPLRVGHPSVSRLRELLLLYGMSQAQAQYISGHFQFSSVAYEQFKHEYAFVTILRDPFKRWVSAYFYDRYKNYGNARTSLNISDYLDDKEAYRNAQIYARSLCGLVDVESYSVKELSELAKDNLHKFELVGCIEHLDVFVDQFYARYGRRLAIGRWNQNPKSKAYQKSVLSDAVMDRVRELCQLDIEIYNYAIE
ncbi:MAG: sulfotransferase family 2 domain-containing protein [Cyanobacteria bacterium J06554_6]